MKNSLVIGVLVALLLGLLGSVYVVREDQTAMVTLTVNPARKADGLTRVGGAKSARGMAAVGVHFGVANG